jgi:hypothetical protein
MCTNRLPLSGPLSPGLTTPESKPADPSVKTEKSQGFFSRIYVFCKRIFFGNNYKTVTPIEVATVRKQLEEFYHPSTVQEVLKELELANNEEITLKEFKSILAAIRAKPNNDTLDSLLRSTARFIVNTPEQNCMLSNVNTEDEQKNNEIHNIRNASIYTKGLIRELQKKLPNIKSPEELAKAQEKLQLITALYKEAVERLQKLDTSTTTEESKTSSIPGNEKRIPCEDFPSEDPLFRSLAKIAAGRLNEGASIRYQTELSTIQLDQIKLGYASPIKPCNGIGGLPNATGHCAVNSSLQLLKATLQTYDLENSDEGKKICSYLQENMPTFYRFVRDQPMSSGDYQKIHQETAKVLSEDYFYSLLSGTGLASEQKETGYFFGSRPDQLLATLLFKCQVSPLCLRNENNGKPLARQVLSLRPQQKSKTFQKNTPLNTIINDQLKKESSVLGEPIPKTLCIKPNIEDFGQVNGILEPITLKGKNGQNITYKPMGIQCKIRTSEDGHGVAFIHKNGLWHEVNDNGVSPIPEAWEAHLSNYLNGSRKGSFASSITYVRSESSDPSVLLSSQATLETAAKPENILHDENWSFVKWMSSQKSTIA